MIARSLQAVSVIFIRNSAWSVSNLSKLKDIQDNSMCEDERIFQEKILQSWNSSLHLWSDGIVSDLNALMAECFGIEDEKTSILNAELLNLKNRNMTKRFLCQDATLYINF